jgi:peptidoglycan/xylan/chitin deacetylase (PgdA/CDA1 family)
MECNEPASTTSPARVTFVASAVGIGALALHAAAGGASELAVIGGLSLGWATLATTGVVFPKLEIYGRVVSRGPVGSARIALTFDDGPHPVTTRRVLEVLAPTRHRATFFVVGEKARRHRSSSARSRRRAHARHPRRLPRSPAFVSLRRVGARPSPAPGMQSKRHGRTPALLSPPLGHTSITTVLGARRAGVTLVGWSSRGYDGMRRRSQAVLKRIGRTLSDDAIVMLHDASEHDDFEPASVRALPQLVALLDERKLSSVGLDALLA